MKNGKNNGHFLPSILQSLSLPHWLALFALVVVGLAAGGYWHYRSEREFIRANQYKDISAIADLKSGQIQRWIRERMADARVLSEDQTLKKAVTELRRNPGDPASRAAIMDRFSTMREGGIYADILLADVNGQILICFPPHPLAPDPSLKQALREASVSRKMALGDFLRAPNGNVFIDIVSPVSDPNGRTMALLILRSDAKDFLFSLIQYWPIPSRTAESLLVRIEGEDVLFLNELRHRPGSPLSLRIPLTRTDLPAVQAALGKQGIFEGRDYRGIEVLANLRPIPGTPWFMVAKIDTSEALEEVRYRAGVVIVVGCLFILLVGAMVALLHRTLREAEQRDAEMELRKSETDLKKAQQVANVGSWTWNIKSNRLEWSDQMFRIFGIGKDGFTGDLGDVITRAIHPDDRAAVERANLSVIRDKKSMPLEYRILWPDGTVRTVWAEAGELILDDAGDPTVLTGIVQDVTDRKRAEEELRRSENRFATVFRASPVCISLTRLSDGQFLDINDAFLRLFGYDREQVIGRNPLMLDMWANPDDRARMVGILRERGRIDGFETTFRTKSGKIRNVIVISEVIDVAGEQYILGLTLDITDRKQAEENYQTLFREMLDGFAQHEMIYDAKGNPADYRFLAVNPAFERLTGLKAENVLGKTVLEVLPGIERSWIETYGRVALTGEPAFFESYASELDRHYVVTAFRPVPNQFACIFSDITDRKRAEEEKEKLQSQLQQAMKMEAIGRLAGGVAHDFNNLLTAILGNVSLALMKLLPSDPSAGMLVEAKKAAERAARLTQQLLAFSRKQIIEPKVLDLNELIAGLETMLARLIGEHIELRTVPHGDLGPVKVDPGQIEQILVNLAVNARDAMPDGGKLFIETANADLDAHYCARHPDSCPGRFVMLAVSDTGHGMNEATLKHIFEPFFTTKPKGSGTGLGLSTIYGAVKQSGGSIEVYSEEGRGTTFKIYLPRVEEEVPKPVGDDGPADLPEGYETVLVVEDEDFVRDLCIKLLERLGYTVLQASGGREAMDMARARGERIDLLMTDVVMPGMNGRELAERLVALHPETKVLFTSGYTDDAIVHHGVLDDGVAFIGKPYSLSALAKKIREVLDR